MEITRHPSGKILTLTLVGRLDGSWSEHTSDLLNTTLAEGWHHLRLNLEAVSFLSSAGIRTLMLHYKRLAELKGSLIVISPSKAVRDVLEMAGLHELLLEAPAAPLLAGEDAAPSFHPFPGGSYESYSLNASAALTPSLLSVGQPICCPEDALCIGLGSLGSEPATAGEFLALGGTALAQPADSQQSVDYLATQGHLQPRVSPLSGIAARGAFAYCLRFESDEPQRGIPLSALLELGLKVTGSDAVGIAFAAETESLVGAALLRAPESGPLALAPFPEIRDQMLFTAEPAWPRSLTLGAAFVSRTAEHPLSSQLRSSGPEGSPLYAHSHAVAFPYRPLAKGLLELRPTVDQLLENERPLGILHLLNDRRCGGLGESRFYRGALWVAPLTPLTPLN